MPESYNGWVRVSKQNPCPACGSFDWCLVQQDGTAAICPREGKGSVRYIDDAGYLHRFSDKTSRFSVRSINLGTDSIDDKMMTVAPDFILCCSPSRLLVFARSLGVTSKSLRRLRTGWAPKHQAFSFPMEDSDRNIVGIRLRAEDGRKFALAGGHQGLHVPFHLGKPRTLLLTEGATDCAAMLDLGFAAVGRPSCSGATQFAVDLVKRLRLKSVVIVADNDEPKPDGRRPGIEGATRLATTLALHATTRIIIPPQGIKDARAWKIAGATAAEVQAAIDAAPIVKVALTIRIARGVTK